jgi:hypothetical protein
MNNRVWHASEINLTNNNMADVNCRASEWLGAQYSIKQVHTGETAGQLTTRPHLACTWHLSDLSVHWAISVPVCRE